MGRLHDALKASGYEGHGLEVCLVRLLFCLFADDTGIFEKDTFREYLELRTAEDGSNLGSTLAQFFQTLDTPRERRHSTLDEHLAQFQYVNGKLFEESLPIASFNAAMREALLECCALDWGKISPAIFGSMFQSVMSPEQRRNLGAHYTSEKNILKLVKPLFLDELHAEFEKARNVFCSSLGETRKLFHPTPIAVIIVQEGDEFCACAGGSHGEVLATGKTAVEVERRLGLVDEHFNRVESFPPKYELRGVATRITKPVGRLFECAEWRSVWEKLQECYQIPADGQPAYKNAFDEVCGLEAKGKEWKLRIDEYDPESDDSGGGRFGVSVIDPETDESFGMEFSPWEEWKASAIDPETDQKYSSVEIVAHCLEEMTFCGFSRKDVTKTSKKWPMIRKYDPLRWLKLAADSFDKVHLLIEGAR